MIDNTILVSCDDIAAQQKMATMKTLNLCAWLLEYIHTYQNPSITCCKSDMHLWIVSDSSYLSVAKLQSRVGGYHFLSNKPCPSILMNEQQLMMNAPVHVEALILKNIMITISEAEISGACVNVKAGILLRMTLLEMGHPQEATPLEMDNATAHGILTK